MMAPAQHNPDYQPAKHYAGSSVPGSLSVLIDFPLPLEYVRQIAAVDPRVLPFTAFTPVHDETSSPGSKSESGWKKVEDNELDAILSQTDVLFTFWPQAGWLDKAPRLKW